MAMMLLGIRFFGIKGVYRFVQVLSGGCVLYSVHDSGWAGTASFVLHCMEERSEET
jgi:hypothetical protein